MSASATVMPAGQVIVGPLNVYVAPAGTAQPIIDKPVRTSGNIIFASGAADDANGVDAAIAAAPSERGFGSGSSVLFTVAQKTSAQVAWFATSGTPNPVPNDYTKRTTGATVRGNQVDVYTAAVAANAARTTSVTFGGTSVWTPLGIQDSRDISDTGIAIEHTQTITPIRSVGSSGPIKYVREEEDLKVSFEIMDLTPATYAAIMGGVTVTDIEASSSRAGYKEIPFHQGAQVKTFALVARGDGLSSYVAGGNIQYYIPYAVQAGSPTPTFTKSGAAMLAVEFMAQENPAGGRERFGVFRQQDSIRA